ncbi:MAG: heme ABC exporter ATP-binding protein CcmA [Alphaproteobacteria bacterium]|nr:heme ABC exporter ATP-binding protein CcmA [Alphaproteobacteria bacterium]
MTTFSGHGLTCIRGERLVFEGLTFAVDAGSVLFLTGPNGSGKTSLMRLMAGLARPAVGTLTWDGAPVDDDPDGHRARLRYLGHENAVKPALTVGDDLEFWCRWRGGVPDSAPETAQRLALDHLWETPCRFLSAGQRRRLALARLITVPASLWLLDEPAVGLDHESLITLETLLAGHCASGGCAVVATHQELSVPGADRLDFAAVAGAP